MAFSVGKPKAWRDGAAYKVSAQLSYADQARQLYYKANAGPLSTGIEPFLAASLFAAMKLGIPLGLACPGSPRLLEAATRIEQIFQSWDSYLRPAPIRAKVKSLEAQPADRQVACFFSGGVDSFYTVLKHRDEIDVLIFVHGFDITLDNRHTLDRISTSVRSAAAELGMPLIEVETNFREFSDTFLHWNYYHGAALASVALVLSPILRKVYIPASDNYARLRPWGSHPLVDPLWSTEAVEIVHDGCEATRVDKITFLSDCEPALKYLRVCYRAHDSSQSDVYNCGECEKCLRTQVALSLAGVLDRCPTFSHSLDLRAIASSPITGEGARGYAMENLERAERLNADPALIQALRHSLSRSAAIRVTTGQRYGAVHTIIQELQEENSLLRTQVRELSDSKSWRLTAPLRAMGRAFRKLHLSSGNKRSLRQIKR